MIGSWLTWMDVRLSLTRMVVCSVAVTESSGWIVSDGTGSSFFSGTGGSGVNRSSFIFAMLLEELFVTHSALDAWVDESSHDVTSALRSGNSKADPMTGGWRDHEAVGVVTISVGRPHGD